MPETGTGNGPREGGKAWPLDRRHLDASATRSFALRLLGLRASSPAAATSGRRLTGRSVALWPHRQAGAAG